MAPDRKSRYSRDSNKPCDHKDDKMAGNLGGSGQQSFPPRRAINSTWSYPTSSYDNEALPSWGSSAQSGASDAEIWSNNGHWVNSNTATTRNAPSRTSPTLTRNAVDHGREREAGDHGVGPRTRRFVEASSFSTGMDGGSHYQPVQSHRQQRRERETSGAHADGGPVRYEFTPALQNSGREPTSTCDAELNASFRRHHLTSHSRGESFSSGITPSASTTYSGQRHDHRSPFSSRGTLLKNGFTPAVNPFAFRASNAYSFATGQNPQVELAKSVPAPQGYTLFPGGDWGALSDAQSFAIQQSLALSSRGHDISANLSNMIMAPTPYAHRPAPEQPMDEVLREYTRLEKSRYSHEKARAEAYGISDIANHVVMFCIDHSGSRLVQALIQNGKSDVKEQVLKEVHPNLLQLSMDPYGNYVIQRLLQYGTQNQKITIWNALRGHVASLSCNKHACRVVQDALKHVLVTQQLQIIEEMEPALEDLIRDQYGMHLVQVALEVVARVHVAFIYKYFRGHVYQLAQDKHCCRILQTMLIKGLDADRAFIMAEMSAKYAELATHQYGNYVLQKAIVHALPADRDALLDVLKRDAFHLAQSKAGSHVIEAIIDDGPEAERRALLANFILIDPKSGRPRLTTLLTHEFGNYVCKKLLQDCYEHDRATFDAVWRDVYPFLLATRQVSSQKTVKIVDEVLKAVLGTDTDVNKLIDATVDMDKFIDSTSRLRVDVGSPAPTPQLTMEPDSPVSNPPSTRDVVDVPVNRIPLPGTEEAKLNHQASVDGVTIHTD